MKRLVIAGFVYLIFTFSVFAKDSGIIRCDAGMKSIPALTEPGGAHVVKQLPCNEVVSLIGLEKGYFKIDLDNRAAYVYAKYIRLLEFQKQPTIAIPEQAEDLKPQSAEQSLSASQQPQKAIQNYAPYSVALLPDVPGREVVLPFITTDYKLAFFLLSEVQQASKEGRLLGRPVSYGELVSLIGELQIEVNRLHQENGKLWAVVTKSSPPQTIVVQTQPERAVPVQPVQQNNDALMKYMLIRQLFPSPTQPQTINLNFRDCARYPALCVR